MAAYQPVVHMLKRELDLKVTRDQGNIIDLIDSCMRFVGRYKEMSGSEKKKVVIHIVSRIIKKHFTKASAYLLEALPTIIDDLYVIAPKVYGKIKKKWFQCF